MQPHLYRALRKVKHASPALRFLYTAAVTVSPHQQGICIRLGFGERGRKPARVDIVPVVLVNIMRLTWWTTTACAAVLSQALSTGPARLRDMARQQNLGVEARASQQSLLGAQPLQCLEVTSPVLTDRGAETAFSPTLDATSRGATHCQLTLMDYHFANSYGQPFVGK